MTKHLLCLALLSALAASQALAQASSQEPLANSGKEPSANSGKEPLANSKKEPLANSGKEPSAEPWAIGTAWSTDKSEVLYREIHFANDPDLDLTTRVEYRTPDGELFGEKDIDYSVSTTAPAISQADHRNDARITTRHPNAEPGPYVELEVRPHDSDEIQREQFDYEEGLIIDAGFDPFVREHWDRLVDGRRITTDFLVPARMDTVHISIRKTDNDECNFPSQNMHCFIINPAGLLRMVSWFVDPILIGYDADSRRLLMFEGVSNFRDDAGEPRNTLIHFEYF
ncbi:hypothetical protein PHACT_07600 [Pseudohongiella acticola]|uniref:DUF3108 domain-containing protein n=1 Tax=Pseudohongiella acticola TaxID=1524254 RepID=A0A1E8CKS4_9GAMM|nr:hypothetical protein [Pseudohongiella acticola]OFE13018.1 hypothetical protein PHACT_07600 [Pseudohongiella acticola]